MGADIYAKDVGGNTALHGAARWNRHEIARLLQKKGAGINARDKLDLMALRMAVSNGDIALQRLLLQNGAGINTRDDCGKRLMDKGHGRTLVLARGY